jgi:predicted nucleic acid-binding protein
MSVFVDTSALMAVIDRNDALHKPARAVWDVLTLGDQDLITTSYVQLELHALLQRRVGVEAVQLLASVFVPVLDVYWVSREEHDSALDALLTANRRELSLVDCVSFLAMRELGLASAFTFDRHFAEQGFGILPGPA